MRVFPWRSTATTRYWSSSPWAAATETAFEPTTRPLAIVDQLVVGSTFQAVEEAELL
jgi:hypothetical protein